MLRPGRFRHRLLETSFLKKHSAEIYHALVPFLEMWKKKELADFEIASIYIFIFSFFRRPTDFLGGPHGDFKFREQTQGVRARAVIEVLRKHLPASFRDRKILDRLNTDDFFVQAFCALSWRSIPLSVPRSLRAWQSGLYSLELLTTVPTPEHVLEMQCQGQRCVTMLIEASELENFVEEGRDVLGFIVHDLIHADHFFVDPARARAQVLFCQKLRHVYELPQIQVRLKSDPVFRSEFYYLMSDMNSVPLHLLKTLKAVLLGHFKRQREADFTVPLGGDDEREFLGLLQDSLKPWDLDTASWEAALRLNTPLSRGTEDALLLDVALNKFS